VSESFEFTCKPERGVLRGLRDSLREQLTVWEVAGDATNRILLVVDEIVGNSIDHGGSYRVSAELAVTLRIEDRDLHVVFVDPDTPEGIVRELGERIANATEPPPLDSERGRGLFLIGRSLEDVLFEWCARRGMVVTGVFRGVAQ